MVVAQVFNLHCIDSAWWDISSCTFQAREIVFQKMYDVLTLHDGVR